MPGELAWQAWRLRQARKTSGKRWTMGEIAQRLGVGDPRNPTQIKRWVADCTRYLKTPACQALLLSEGFVRDTRPTFEFDGTLLQAAVNKDRNQRGLDDARARLRGK
jgi:hypothetical protein